MVALIVGVTANPKRTIAMKSQRKTTLAMLAALSLIAAAPAFAACKAKCGATQSKCGAKCGAKCRAKCGAKCKAKN